MAKTKTTKKVSKGCPEGQVPDGKGGCMPKPKIVKIVKPTADSTNYFKNEQKKFKQLGSLYKGDNEISKFNKNFFYQKEGEAASNQLRQKFKGKPGYDKNGFPIKKKR